MLEFDGIKIWQNKIIINGKEYDPKFIKFKYRGARTKGFFIIYYFGERIYTYIHDSIIMGDATRTPQKLISETIEKIKKGINITEIIDQEEIYRNYCKEYAYVNKFLLIIFVIIILPTVMIFILSKITT